MPRGLTELENEKTQAVLRLGLAVICREPSAAGRRPVLMKTRHRHYLRSIALVLALLLSGCASNPEVSVSAATVNRDCGPADGPAFTVSIPLEERGTLMISIWQAPEIVTPMTFALSNPTDMTGSASLRTDADALDPVSGTITFDSVLVNSPVDGEYRLTSSSGELFEGSFSAVWVEFTSHCG